MNKWFKRGNETIKYFKEFISSLIILRRKF